PVLSSFPSRRSSDLKTVTLAGNTPLDFDKKQIPGPSYPSVRKRDARRGPLVGPRDYDKRFFKTHRLFPPVARSLLELACHSVLELSRWQTYIPFAIIAPVETRMAADG